MPVGPFGAGRRAFACEKFHKRLTSRRMSDDRDPARASGARAQAPEGPRRFTSGRWVAVGAGRSGSRSSSSRSCCSRMPGSGSTGASTRRRSVLLVGVFVGGGGSFYLIYRQLMGARQRR